jgi:hypothetical protein
VAPPFDPVMAGADPDDGSRGANQRWPLAQRLMTLADLEYDPDAYIAAVHAGGPEDRHASEIAKRLIDAKRPAEALQWLEKPRRRGQEADNTDVDLRIAALAALEREDEVQALRWVTFEQMLSIGHLRAYLKGLPDFEDFDAEQKALAIAAGHKLADLALEFMAGWPALDRAAALVRDRITDLDGRAYETPRPAAQALEKNTRTRQRFSTGTWLRALSIVPRPSIIPMRRATWFRPCASRPPGHCDRERRAISRAAVQTARPGYGFWTLIDQKGH